MLALTLPPCENETLNTCGFLLQSHINFLFLHRKGRGDLSLKHCDRRRVVLENQAVGTDYLQRIHVLTEKEDVHDILGASAFHFIAKLADGALQTGHNGLALTSNSQTAQVSGFGFCLGTLDLAHLVSFSLVRSSFLETTTGIDFCNIIRALLVPLEPSRMIRSKHSSTTFQQDLPFMLALTLLSGARSVTSVVKIS